MFKKNESLPPEKQCNLISQTNQLTVRGKLTVNLKHNIWGKCTVLNVKRGRYIQQS